MLSDLGIAAQEYAKRGFPVLALIPGQKEPALSNGFLSATTRADVIEAWWTSRPEFNIGIRTGIAFDCLDIDGEEGITTFKRLLPDAGYHHLGPAAHTGRADGLHLLFAPSGLPSKNGFATKLDFKADGAYIVVAPSVHPNGSIYRWWTNHGPSTPLPAVPGWLLRHLTPPPAPVRRPESSQGIHGGQSAWRANRPSILAVAHELGLNPKRHGGDRYVVSCLWHEERTPSLVLYTKDDTFRCYGGSCQAHGDSHDLKRRTYIGAPR